MYFVDDDVNNLYGLSYDSVIETQNSSYKITNENIWFPEKNTEFLADSNAGANVATVKYMIYWLTIPTL